MVLGAAERKSPFTPINAISHMFFGDEPYEVRTPTPRYFVTGLALNFAAMVGWAVVVEVVLQWLHLTASDRAMTFVVAVGVTVLAAVVDFVVVPKRFTPGFEHVLSLRSLVIVYAFLAASLVAGGLMRV
jgi:hypothetical protein